MMWIMKRHSRAYLRDGRDCGGEQVERQKEIKNRKASNRQALSDKRARL